MMILLIGYELFGMNSNFLWIYLIAVLSGLSGTAIGFFLACMMPDTAQVAILFGPLVLSTMPNVFGSIFRPLPEIWIGFRWLSWFTPASFYMPVAMWLEFKDVSLSPGGDRTPAEIAKTKENYEEAIYNYLDARRAFEKFALENILFCVALVFVYRMAAWGLLMWKSRTMY